MQYSKSFTLLVAVCISFVTLGYGQPKNYKIVNGIGLSGGITQYDIITDNFTTKKGNGWMASASATVDLPHKWYNVSYTMQLAENHLGIAASPVLLSNEELLIIKFLPLK
ncbi:hypothetical protein ACW5R3_01600 [Bizionia sp. KMM 8389]